MDNETNGKRPGPSPGRMVARDMLCEVMNMMNQSGISPVDFTEEALQMTIRCLAAFPLKEGHKETFIKETMEAFEKQLRIDIQDCEEAFKAYKERKEDDKQI